ncbi:transmembrane protein 171 [Rhynchocyon petersi]
MSPTAAAERNGDPDRHVEKLIFFLFVFGAFLLCVGVLLSIVGFQACQYDALTNCSMVLKVAGPSCAVVGLGALILARSRSQLQFLEEQRRGSRADPHRPFLCGESRQFVQCLIFGFLFLTSGLLISVLGIWVPGCGSNWEQEPLNESGVTDPEARVCGLLTLQILGPLIVLVGLCFFVVAHVKKRNSLRSDQDVVESETGQTQSSEPVQVTVGDAVITFPPPPPSYFTESSASVGARSQRANGVLPSEDPPSYYSIFNYRTSTPGGQCAASEREIDSIYTISGTHSASEIPPAPHLWAELPPRYEEKEPSVAVSRSPSSEPSLP